MSAAEVINYYRDPAPTTEQVRRACDTIAARLADARQRANIDAATLARDDADRLRADVTAARAMRDDCLHATELVRRAERIVGEIILDLRQRGEIATQGRPPKGVAAADRPVNSLAYFNSRATRSEYLALARPSIDRFERALADAYADGKMSRANVLRHLKYISYRTRKADGHARPEMLRGTHYPDPNRIVEQTALHSGIAPSTADLIDYDALDRDRIAGWIDDLSAAIRSLSMVRNKLRKVAREGVHQQ